MKKLTILFLFLTLSNANAFKLMPMSYVIEANNKSKTALFTVYNDSDDPIAIQLDMRVRKMKLDGSEDQPESDDFLIFPDQLVLGAKKRRVIKVKWLKGKIENLEKSYRLIAEQLPIDVTRNKKSDTDIKILLRYIAALYVAPKEGKSILKVISSKTTKDLSRIIFYLENIGNIHQILLKPNLKVVQEGKSFEVSNLEGIQGENILAKTKRYFSFIPPSGVNIQKPYKIEFINED